MRHDKIEFIKNYYVSKQKNIKFNITLALIEQQITPRYCYSRVIAMHKMKSCTSLVSYNK